MPELSLLVLAAGVGRRYKGLKQLDSVGPAGETLLDYSLYGALKAGFEQLAFVIRRDIEEAFRGSVGRYWEGHFDVRYVFQQLDAGLPGGFSVPAGRKKPWGTGQALLLSRPVIAGPFGVINADDFYGLDGFVNLAAWLRKTPLGTRPPDDYCFVGYRLRDTLSEHGTVSRGVCRMDPRGFLTEVVERLKIEKQGEGARALDEDGRWIPLTGEEVVSMNFWGFTPSIFGHLAAGFAAFLERSGGNPEEEYYIPCAVNELLGAGKIRVKHIPTTDRWFGLTHREDLPLVRARVRELVKEGLYPERIRTRGGL